MTVRTLVLSGGGGRGAFHAGVYKYLCQENKPGIDPQHSGAWVPDVVVGTSIGAVNGAAIVQGVSAEELERFWLSLQEHDIQGLPPSMGWLARRVINMGLKRSIGVPLPRVPEAISFSPGAEESWPPLPVMPRWLSRRLIGRWNNLLDTGPLYQTLINRLGLDEARIAASEQTLIIRATNVRTGEGVAFCNHELTNPRTGERYHYVRSPVTIRRIIASCSIPMVYPWTRDDDGELYWDGAVVANTPLGSAFDAVKHRPIEETMEAVVVMMTPWWETAEDAPLHEEDIPGDFGEAMTWTLDWALLASFRVDLKLARSYNHMAELAVEAGKQQPYRLVRDVIVAPRQFLPVARIIDYDEPASRDLIQKGYEAAERAFKARFGVEQAADATS
jgi:NTE family protein